MSLDEIESIANGWLQHMRLEPPEDRANSWAFDTLYDLCFASPEDAWLVTQARLSRELNLHLKSLVAAGPIENLLAQHGPLFIERIEDRAMKDAEFKTILGGVWKNTRESRVLPRLRSGGEAECLDFIGVLSLADEFREDVARSRIQEKFRHALA